MAKSSTKPNPLPKLDEWKAPWEVKKDDEGNEVDIPAEEQVIDGPRLKKYLYGLLNDKIGLRSSLDETTARAEELEQKVANATDPEQVKTLQEELKVAQRERDDAKAKTAVDANALKWEIALEKGLSKTQAKRLVGATREELEADADELITEFGGKGEGSGAGGEVRSAPRRKLTNSGDPNPEEKPEDADDEDPNKVYENWRSSH